MTEPIQWGDGAKRLGLTVRNPDAGLYRVTHVWTTQDGSWDVSGKPYSVPDWAWDFLRAGKPDYFHEAGGSQHLFARINNRAGQFAPMTIEYSAPGQYDTRRTDQSTSGWANLPIYSPFDPDVTQGPWQWGPVGGPYIVGGGLPYSWHVSCFAVWQERAVPVPQPDPDPQPKGDVWVAMRVADGQVREAHTAGDADTLIDRILGMD